MGFQFVRLEPAIGQRRQRDGTLDVELGVEADEMRAVVVLLQDGFERLPRLQVAGVHDLRQRRLNILCLVRADTGTKQNILQVSPSRPSRSSG